MIQLCIDFGLVVLIWMTQLVVYPSFEYLGEKGLDLWHERYTKAISIIVMPLMIGQLLIHLYAFWEDFNLWRGAALTLILLAWANTFFVAVPLHSKISSKTQALDSARKLVRMNWYRTLLWSLVFVLAFFVKNRGLLY